ncbi:methyltransferase domain-containing protein [Phenylobacterium sp.]|uniref:methyltransferase domain-containing protein n=1 Tax=Phenylobacterium sp. TaxID=1871053 RepID=UPI0035B44D83
MPAPTSSAPPQIFDRSLHRKRLDRAAAGFPDADFLKRRAAEDAVARLETILRDFPLAVDLGARTGVFRQALEASDAAARVGRLVEADLSLPMLGGRGGARLVADEERLPFAAESLDLVVSTLSLHWANDVVGALIQIRRALKPDGLFIGALLGGATLTELRQSLMAAEAEILGGAGSRVSPFADAYDAAGLLQRAGFALPVADVDRVTVRYRHPLMLMADLRRMGETNVLAERHPKPLTRALIGRASEIYLERFAEADGKIPATFEILTLTGWAPHESQQKPLKPGSAKMRLADALGVEEVSVPRGDDQP